MTFTLHLNFADAPSLSDFAAEGRQLITVGGKGGVGIPDQAIVQLPPATWLNSPQPTRLQEPLFCYF
ncbi:MAG: hypothetical protein LH660_04555 [Phormidesmis sp. CAN_BIN36]|nr:hypothetical protein [Phormidesmis sp. CAN_BIN36]